MKKLRKKFGLKLLILIIAVAMITIGIIFSENIKFFVFGLIAPLPNVCTSDSQCEWRITNCCSEQAGAKWECVNTREFKQPECPSIVICPQVLSPKPAQPCVCELGKCVTK